MPGAGGIGCETSGGVVDTVTAVHIHDLGIERLTTAVSIIRAKQAECDVARGVVAARQGGRVVQQVTHRGRLRVGSSDDGRSRRLQENIGALYLVVLASQ